MAYRVDWLVGVEWKPSDAEHETEIEAIQSAEANKRPNQPQYRIFDTESRYRLTESDIRMLINVKISEGLAWPNKLGKVLRGRDCLWDQPNHVYTHLRELGRQYNPSKMATLSLRQLRVMLQALRTEKSAEQYRRKARLAYNCDVLKVDNMCPVAPGPGKKGAWVTTRVWVEDGEDCSWN